jgi:hypothetical protein
MPGSRSTNWPLERILLLGQGLYYQATGVWPLIDIESFQAVTGRKTDHLVTGLEADHWLVMTVGVLVTSIAIGLLTAAYRQTASLEICIVAVCAAGSLATIDAIYVYRGVILPIYLLDCFLDGTLVIVWLGLGIARFRRAREAS